MTDEPRIIDKQWLLSCFHDKEQVTMRRILFLYGGDIEAILNALHSMAARLAIVTGVEPEMFAAAMKHHWDGIAEVMNAVAAARERPN